MASTLQTRIPRIIQLAFLVHHNARNVSEPLIIVPILLFNSMLDRAHYQVRGSYVNLTVSPVAVSVLRLSVWQRSKDTHSIAMAKYKNVLKDVRPVKPLTLPNVVNASVVFH